MRIRHVVLTRSFAGVERHVCVLANAQARRGDEVEVWGGAPSAMRELLDERVRHRPARRVLPVALRGLVEPAPDVVHAHMTAAETAALASGVIRGAPVVATRHFAATRGSSPAGRRIRGIVGRRVSAQIAISRYVASRVEGDTTVVYPGVEATADAVATRRPVVLVVQRLQPEKRTAVALRTFAAGAPAGWRLEIVGQGVEQDALRVLADDLGIADRTHFLGFRDDVPALMATASVLLAPCEVEGLGLSVLEAMAHALPVLASSAGAHLETVGLVREAQLFTPGNIGDAAARLNALCRDDAFRARYGEQLLKVQRETFTPQAQVQATESVYWQVLA